MALLLFRYRTISQGDSVTGQSINICTWSGITSIAIILYFLSSHKLLIIIFRSSEYLFVRTENLNLGHHMIQYQIFSVIMRMIFIIVDMKIHKHHLIYNLSISNFLIKRIIEEKTIHFIPQASLWAFIHWSVTLEVSPLLISNSIQNNQ